MLASSDLKHLCLPGPHLADNCVIDDDVVKVPEAGEYRTGLVDLDIRIAAHASKVASSMSRLGQRLATGDPLMSDAQNASPRTYFGQQATAPESAIAHTEPSPSAPGRAHRRALPHTGSTPACLSLWPLQSWGLDALAPRAPLAQEVTPMPLSRPVQQSTQAYRSVMSRRRQATPTGGRRCTPP
jgi:hypothetical protein